jgi:hypothetical protein
MVAMRDPDHQSDAEGGVTLFFLVLAGAGVAGTIATAKSGDPFAFALVAMATAVVVPLALLMLFGGSSSDGD